MSTWSGRRRRRGRPGLELRGVRAVEKERQRPVMKTLKSFDHIKTVNGHQAVTFSEAAENLDLLSGDHIVEKCLDEAVLYQALSLSIQEKEDTEIAGSQLNITYKSRKWIAFAAASSGIAASILPGGRTTHSIFKIPIDGDDKYVYTI
nr:ATP-dependent DNA helicase pfh1-like [Ipomoea batatas]